MGNNNNNDNNNNNNNKKICYISLNRSSASQTIFSNLSTKELATRDA